LWSDPPPLELKESTDGNDDDEGDDPDHLSSNAHAIDSSLQSRQASSKHHKSSTEDILHFHSTCLPSKLILVRHGQSEANVDESLYATKADNAMVLTRLGWDMAKAAGRALREQLPEGETVHFIVSPYARTVETFHGMASAWADPEDLRDVEGVSRCRRMEMWYARLMEMGLTWHEDPRIREQDCECDRGGASSFVP